MKTFTVSTLAVALSIAQVAQCNPSWHDLRGKIKHVVYLMMENHSFDNIAGYWKFHPGIDNLVGKSYCNNYTNPTYTIWGEPLSICAGPYEQEVPYNDPDHSFAGTSFEIYRDWNPSKHSVPTMGGFVDREANASNLTPGAASFVMQAYSEEKTRLLATIAQNFAFFDSYHAEHPGSTGPNRLFATAGSACGQIDTGTQPGIGDAIPPANCTTSIFEALSNKKISWKNYYETNIVDAYMWKWVQDNALENIVQSTEFFEDIKKGTLPQFSYYNPECCTIDSMHPKSNLAGGEQLIKHIYDALRNSKYWENTLFIINFDEHGGFYDHVPPPTNIPAPDDNLTYEGLSDGHNITFDYTRLGVRVPAFLISPWIKPNTLIHNEGTSYAHNSAYTHSSMLHFVQELFELDGLNNRVQWAKTFEHVFTDNLNKKAPTNLPVPIWYGSNYQVQPAKYPAINTVAPPTTVSY
ncbi:phosphatidylglycerol specific phospholipase [Dipodascopsis uninucleata]